jgi:NCS1 family nucleobase:cation symporter-1
VLIDFYLLKHREPMGFSEAPPWNRNGLIAFIIGLVVSIPFMSEAFYTGPLASWFSGADFGYFIGFIVAGVVYVVLSRRRAPQH